jgi:hypothetical protein
MTMSDSQMKIFAGVSLVAAVFGYSQMGSIGAFVCVALVVAFLFFKFVLSNAGGKTTENVLDEYWLWIEPIMAEAGNNGYKYGMVTGIANFADLHTTWTWVPGADEKCIHYTSRHFGFIKSSITDFLSDLGNIDAQIIDVPGLGPQCATTFRKHGITTVRHLINKFNGISGGHIHAHNM